MKDISTGRGASDLVLSGELTEGTSDLSQAMTAPGGVPALPEVNQDRAHPQAPEVQEQPGANFRRIVESERRPAGSRLLAHRQPAGPDRAYAQARARHPGRQGRP